MKKELGSLATHRAYLKQPPKKGSVTPFPCRPAAVQAVRKVDFNNSASLMKRR